MRLRRTPVQQAMEEEKKITVSKSLAIKKHSIKLAIFIAALFYDLSTEKQVRIPTQGADFTLTRTPILPTSGQAVGA